MGYTKGIYLATDATGWSSFTGKVDTGWATQQGSGYSGSGTRYIYISTSGSNANTGTAASPKQTLGAGLALLRDGFPDWLMLKKGDTWTNESFDDISHPNGLDANNLMLVTAYDPANPSVANPASGGAPPIVQTDHTQTFLFDHGNFFGCVGITAYAYTRDPNNGAYSTVPALADGFYSHQPVHTIIIEDCEFRYYTTGPGYPATSSGNFMDDILVRRTVVYNCYTTTADHSVGFESQGQVSNMVWEEVASNHNGWLGTLDAFSRGFYLGVAGDDQFDNPVIMRGCLVANDSSQTQVRCGGYVENNLGFNNQSCINLPAPEVLSYTYKNNVNLTSGGGANFGQPSSNNVLNFGAMEISGNIFARESASTSAAIGISCGSNGFNTHDNVVYKCATPYSAPTGTPTSFDTIVGGSGFTTGTDFYFTCSPAVGLVGGAPGLGETYSDGLGNVFSVNTTLSGVASTFFYATRTTSGSTPAQSGTLTRTSAFGPLSITYTGAFRIYYDIPMKYVTGSGGSGLDCTIYANMSGAITNVTMAAGIVGGGNYSQVGQGYSALDQLTNTSAFGGGTGFSCKVHTVGVNTLGTNKFDPTGSIHAGGGFPEWIDPERTISTYAASIGLAGTEAAFLEAVRTNRKWNYDPRYTANAANNYFRAGFGIGSDTAPPILMAQICM